jgi:tRNA dimethylallyltransferase
MQPIFLVGPTAVGKSAVAIELAKRIDAEIISADSMQVYRGMDIGTAKPTREERKAVRHHLIDVCEVDEPFDVKQFVTLARSVIGRLSSVIVCGGTGLYIRALRRGLFEGPGRDPALRAKLQMLSPATLFAELQRVDPVTAKKLDRHNPRRLVRALEVFYSTGGSISQLQTQWTQAGTPVPPLFCLNRERGDLYARIERRVDRQIAAGWVDEARRLLQAISLLDATIVASKTGILQAAGYRELMAHLRAEISLDEAVARIKTRTRQLARRQLTWFRREPEVIWVDVRADEPATETARRIYQRIEAESDETRRGEGAANV